MTLSSRTRKNWILVFGFAAATAAGCSVQVLPGVGPSQGGGGSLGTGDVGGAAGGTAGSGDAHCDATCDCQTFCADVGSCYAQNFDMSECLQDCETNVPGDLRTCVCEHGATCDGVASCADDTWSGAGSCAPWQGAGGSSLDSCLSCWNTAATGACYLAERVYEADSAALDIATCVEQHHYTKDAIIQCEHDHAAGVVDWDSINGCATCAVCAHACDQTALYRYECGMGDPF